MMTAAEVRAAWPTLSPRERDFLVAEVIGWQDIKRTDDHIYPYGWGFRESSADDRSDEDLAWAEVPRYSTSWADAGPLLEELAGLWGDFECGQSLKDRRWYVDGPWSRDAPMGAPSLVESTALAFVLAKLEAANG